MLIAGVDEAGRGCVIGSLVVGCILFDSKKLEECEIYHDLNDSKKLSPAKRERLDKQIDKFAEEVCIVDMTAKEINKNHASGMTLNEMGVQAFADALNLLDTKPDAIYLDAADIFEERFGKQISEKLKWDVEDFPKVFSEHKGDEKWKVVSAASIVAKVYRDEGIEYLKSVGKIEGSGYPADPYTRKFLEEYYAKNKKFPPEARKKWSTLDKNKEKVENGGIVGKNEKIFYYAVAKGKNVGIYKTWDECCEQVSGVSGCSYKKFKTKKEAKRFIKTNS